MRKQILFSVLAITLLIASLFIPKEVHSETEMTAVALGYPLPFLIQDFSRYTPLVFPQEFSFGSPWEDPFKVLWLNLLVTFASSVLLLNGLFYCTARIVRTQRKTGIEPG